MLQGATASNLILINICVLENVSCNFNLYILHFFHRLFKFKKLNNNFSLNGFAIKFTFYN